MTDPGTVRVTITIERGGHTQTTTREDATIVPGGGRPMVLPVLLAALRAAAVDHIDEIAVIRKAADVLFGVINAVADVGRTGP